MTEMGAGFRPFAEFFWISPVRWHSRKDLSMNIEKIDPPSHPFLDRMGHFENAVNRAVEMIFENYRDALLKNPPTYVAPAVWGEKKNGSLDKDQEMIHRSLEPFVFKIMEDLETSAPSASLEMQYLVRGLLVYKLLYMVEIYKNRGFVRSSLKGRWNSPYWSN